MRRIPQVESAKSLMTEAMTWSVVKWLREKKAVRKAADAANAALDRLSMELKESWPVNVKTAHDLLVSRSKKTHGKAQERKSPAIGDEDGLFVKQVQDADDEALRARMSAERIFDEADKRLSTALAREGCLKAIYAWELKEKAIRKAEEIDPQSNR